ncbi:G-alpha-domain-containing protein [Dendrothele bispora CBS 962.96]|uniref:G-alpha-domain-containing protein n=1 Tax=Dendrothele bispora (strain CBS 962.96) TaxID=1314807 RepID=A0A4S8MRW3_DENBC|nr:G-alpha-domain-containing protein [Dendrothele bispora CBS 962.96]
MAAISYRRTNHSVDYDDPTDPFAELLRPPPDETPAQTTARLKRESDAQRISDEIDEDIRVQKSLAKKESNVVKVLLLGQAESGKSTTLKNFRMRYAVTAWEQERNGWRAVVQLNLIRSIMTILSVIETELNLHGVKESGVVPGSSQEAEVRRYGSTQDDEPDSPDSPSASTTLHSLSYDHDPQYRFTDHHQLLLIRLAPLRTVEANLKRWLGQGSEPVPTRNHLPMSATPFDTPTPPESGLERRKNEFAVRCWRDIVIPDSRRAENGERNSSVHGGPDFESCTITIASCRNDMKALWEDRVVQKALEKRRVRLPDSAGFFLNELDRIATRDYIVTDDDIVRARLKTVGIQEYKVRFKNAPLDAPRVDGAWEWRIFDVGGCRTMRHAWLPFFENTNCIIFLCPVSCFDERLEEDPRVNRLEDSTLLWKSICQTKLLKKTQLILFMNKCDLLKRKLKSGVKLKDYLTSYGERPNEVMSVVKYLREKFKEILKTYSPEPRASYIYPTTVTDTSATAKTLESVRDGVLRENLMKSQLM